ncbi:MAG TPA: dihydrolipoamide acetyltransferase family protein [Actinomycetota bacterium]|jgi:pyruvate dehydrogenase E2 component (dihydrolipoamide acetyltransferase)|nr:dihydrolipoamide acetyltransferase family protein [Actinomycetota bacterium]
MAERSFLLPDPGEGLEEAEVLAWLVEEGDQVELNQPFVEVETAKAAVEIPSPFSGKIVRLHAAVGDVVRVGDVLVTFDVGNPGAGDAPEGALAAGARGAATPAVRKLAKDRSVDLAALTGSGPGGRVTAEDVERASSGSGRSVPVTIVRRTIAERLTQVAAVPQVTTFRTVDCTELEALRGELRVSPLPVFVAALARTCRDHPMLNSTWGGDAIQVHTDVHVGIATDTDRGLVVPVLRNAETLGIAGIGAEIGRLAGAARDGSLRANDLTGSTISVSNSGSYGSEFGTPLLNPGNAVTVALGLIAPRALVVDGEVVARQACTLSLTFDHRVLDGAVVGRALTDLVACLQEADRLRDLPR